MSKRLTFSSLVKFGSKKRSTERRKSKIFFLLDTLCTRQLYLGCDWSTEEKWLPAESAGNWLSRLECRLESKRNAKANVKATHSMLGGLLAPKFSMHDVMPPADRCFICSLAVPIFSFVFFVVSATLAKVTLR